MLPKKIIIVTLAIFFLFNFAKTSFAQTIDEIQQNINSDSDKISQLDAEINAYQKQIEAVNGQAQTLQSAIQALDINQKKISAEIKKTEISIQKTNLTIKDLGGQIGDTENKIISNTEVIAKTLNNMHQNDDQSLIESFLNNKSLSDIFDEYEAMTQFQQNIRDQSKELRTYEQELSDKKTATEAEKEQLLSLESDLNDQNKILAINKKEKNDLLVSTKNQEANYKKILADRLAEKDSFEKELADYQSQLQFKLNPSSLPSSGSGILGWPLDQIRITQLFGDTDFARSHPGAYNGKGHNGVDFAANIGTRVKAAADGVIVGTGNTDIVCPNASYGKWVLIKHNDGLSTLYGHLSIIKVAEGDQVSKADIIGYSGNTGYTTGPHLHFGVFASAGVQITTLKSKVCSGSYTMPVASWSAYLNPLLYLPSL